MTTQIQSLMRKRINMSLNLLLKMQRVFSIGLVLLVSELFCRQSHSLGTPPKEVNLLVDTGSSDLWLTLANCDDDLCENNEKYSPDDSITYHGFNRVSSNLPTCSLSNNRTMK